MAGARSRAGRWLAGWVMALALAAAPSQTRAEPVDFDTFRGVFSTAPLGARRSASLVAGWTQHYRGAVPHAAFAYAMLEDGRAVWRYVSGRASPEAARAAAQAGCDRDLAAVATGMSCRILAIDGTVVDAEPGAPRVVPRQERIGPFRAAPLQFRHGPDAARGAIIWSHGYGGPTRDLRTAPLPGFLSPLNDAGWDVLRFDRDPMEDDLVSSLPLLVRGLSAVRAAGYRRIVLAGHSRGAWQSVLAAAERPDLVEAVIAASPAAHGEAGDQNNLAVAMADFRRLVSALPHDQVRLAIVLFEGDPFDPDPAARAELVGTIAATRLAPTLALWPQGTTGHHAVQDWRFAGRHGACLMTFLHAPAEAAIRGLRREICGGG